MKNVSNYPVLRYIVTILEYLLFWMLLYDCFHINCLLFIASQSERSDWEAINNKQLIIFLHLFRSCSNGQLSGGNPDRLKYYYLVGYLLPIVIPVGFATFCLSFKNFEFLYGTWVIVAKQRSIPGLHFALRTEDFVKTFGLFEIIIKLVTLGFFVGSIFYIWKTGRVLRELKVQIHAPPESKYEATSK